MSYQDYLDSIREKEAKKAAQFGSLSADEYYTQKVKQEKLLEEKNKKNLEDYTYATTPANINIASFDKTKSFVENVSKNMLSNKLQYSPIAVEGAPVNPNSGIKLVSQEVYDAAMEEREAQEREIKYSPIAEFKARQAANEKTAQKFGLTPQETSNYLRLGITGNEEIKASGISFTRFPTNAQKNKIVSPSDYSLDPFSKSRTIAISREYNKNYRTALNDFRAEMGLSSMSPELFQEYEKAMEENEILPSDNEYIKQQKENNRKTVNITFNAITKSNFSFVSQKGSKISADALDGDRLKTIHNIINGLEFANGANRIYSMLNETEKAVWNYYIGDGDTKTALDYIKVLHSTLESRLAQTVSEEYDEQGVWGDVKEIGASVLGGFEKGFLDMGRAVGGVADAFGLKMDTISASMFEPTYSEKLANYVLADSNGADGKFFNAFLSALNSIAYQAPSYAINAVGGGMAGYVIQGIGANTTEGIRNNDNSIANVIYGVYEGAMEFAVDKLLGGASSQLAGKGATSVTKSLLKHVDEFISNKTVKTLLSKTAIHFSTTGSEALEELIQALAEPAARAVIYGEKMDYSLDTLENALEASFVGGISGFLMGFATTGSTYKQYQSEVFGNNLISTGSIDSLIKFAEDFGATDSTVYDSVKEAVQNKNTPDALEVAQLYSQTMQKYNNFDEADIARFVKNTANETNVSDIANMFFNGNTEAAQKYVDKYSKLEISDSNGTKAETPNVILGTAENYDSIQNIDGQATTGYNNNTNINQDKGGIEDVTSDRLGKISENEAHGFEENTESQEQRTRQEDDGTFRQRNSGSVSGRRIILPIKTSLFAYTPKNADGSQASKAVEILNKAGIKAVYCEGNTESNADGITTLHTEAVTTPDGTIYVSDGSSLSSIQIAAHESVHYHQKNNTAEYAEYQSAINDNVLWDTDGYLFIAKQIFNGHHRTKYENKVGRTLTENEVNYIITSPKYRKAFLIEFTAYVNEAISANSTKTIELFSKVFSNWDAVVEASRNFNDAIGLDFSSADTATESSPIDSQSTGTDGETAPTGGRVLEMPAITVKQQNFVKKIGKALGRKVEFVNMEKFLREHDVNTEKLKIYPDGAIDGEGNIYIWYNAEKPVQFLFKHELTHFGERSKYYKRFVEFVRGTKTYKKWMREKVKTSESYKEWLKENPKEVGKKLRITQVEGFLKQDHINVQSKLKENFGKDAALAEVIADFVGENCFGESLKGLEALIDEANLKQHSSAIQYLVDFFAYLKKKLSGNKQITFELSQIEDSFRRLISDANNTKTSDNKDGGLKYSFEGYAEDGKGKYKSNFPKGTPKAAKADVILRYIQNVWSKKPIRLKIEEGGKIKYIEAQFDPTYDETGHEYSDATKLMGGNRHGTAAEQRVTLDLADDYYQIASESRYNYSKDETGKDNPAHKDVVKWHYFVNDIYFAEYDSTDYSPYRVSINVKEKADGNFVYSFSAEKQESDTPQTLHAVVNEGNNSNANVQLSNNKVTQDAPVVKNNSMQESENYSSEKNGLKFSVPTATENETDEDTQSTDFTAEFKELMQSFQNGEISQNEYMQRMSELYQRAIEENGQIKPGEKVSAENKDFPIPKSVKDGTKVRQHTRSILKSGRVTEEQESFLKETVLDGHFSYTPTSNEKNIKNAEKAIEKEGYQKAKENWMSSVVNMAADASMVAKGEILLQLAFEQKNAVDIVNLATQLAELGTYIGQSLQAMSLVKRMGGIGQLVYLERCVARINESLRKRIEKGKAETVTIDPTLAQQLAESKTEAEFEITYAAIVEDIAAQVPSTFADKWNALRYVCMLLNPVTHIRNMTGNGVFFPAVRIKNLLAVGLEKGVSKDKRTKVVKVKKAYQEFAEKDFAEVADLITGTGKYNPSDEIRSNRRIFKTTWLELARKFNFDLLEKEDAIFLKKHYKHALGGYLQAQGTDLSNVSIQQLTKAREYAMQEAMKATYRDASKAANTISRLAKTNAFTEIIVEGLIPYKKTPINIIKRGVEYSPIGLIKTLSKGIYDLNQENITTTQFIDGLACGLTGTGVCILGAFLASLGIVKGSFDDEEKWFRKLNGEQEYSIQIGNFSYTIDWATPASIPLFLGVAIAEYDSDEDEDILSSIWNFGIASFEPLLNLSLLSGLEDAIAAVSYADDGEKITSFLGTTMESYFAQLLPTLFGKTANLFDDTRRTNYIDRTSNIPVVIQEAWNKIASKLPFASQTRAEYVDAWGETQYTGNFMQRFFQQFVSPGYSSTVNVTDVSEELLRLYRQTGTSGLFPSTPQKYFKIRGNRRDLSKEEYFEYSTFKGQTQADLVDEAIHSKEYSKLSDEQKAEVIKDIYSYAGALAKCQLDYSYEEIASMEGEDKKGNLILTKEKYNRLNDKARQMLIDEYFMESSGNAKAYKTAKNGKSVVEYFCKKVKE